MEPCRRIKKLAGCLPEQPASFFRLFSSCALSARSAARHRPQEQLVELFQLVVDDTVAAVREGEQLGPRDALHLGVDKPPRHHHVLVTVKNNGRHVLKV